MTFSHLFGKLITNGGFSQKVPLPATPYSNKLASFHSASMNAELDLVFGTAAYTVPIPKGAIIMDLRYLQLTAFSGGTSPSVQVGSTVSGTDVLGSTALSASFRGLPAKYSIAASTDAQTLFVTITGGPAAGAGKFVISYYNPAVTGGDGVKD